MSGGADFDRFIDAAYEAAFELDWDRFRAQTLTALCTWSGASAAAWLLRARDDLDGEFAQWPADAGFTSAALAGLPLGSGHRETTMQEAGNAEALALRFAHRGSSLQSVLVLRGADPAIERVMLRRVLGHLVQAATLALRQFVQRDEWLMAMGRSSRGSAALVDRQGVIYMTSDRFRELVGLEPGSTAFSVLPFELPAEDCESPVHFRVGNLRLRAQRMGRLLLINARRPHPLDELSGREQEIARALAQGKSFKSVARELDIALSTVANHASRIYRKLGIFRREELTDLLRRSAEGKAA